jgi:hypothetical protein
MKDTRKNKLPKKTFRKKNEKKGKRNASHNYNIILRQLGE